MLDYISGELPGGVSPMIWRGVGSSNMTVERVRPAYLRSHPVPTIRTSDRSLHWREPQ